MFSFNRNLPGTSASSSSSSSSSILQEQGKKERESKVYNEDYSEALSLSGRLSDLSKNSSNLPLKIKKCFIDLSPLNQPFEMIVEFPLLNNNGTEYIDEAFTADSFDNLIYNNTSSHLAYVLALSKSETLTSDNETYHYFDAASLIKFNFKNPITQIKLQKVDFFSIEAEDLTFRHVLSIRPNLINTSAKVIDQFTFIQTFINANNSEDDIKTLSESQCILGDLYARGNLAVKKDTSLAIHWYNLSAFKENPYANERLAKFTQNERFTSVKIDAIKGVKEAQHLLAEYYWQGYGTEKDLKQAFEWFKKASRQGLKKSNTYLGHFYEHGMGTEKDPKQAFELYTKAGMNDSVVVNKLGYCYQNGIIGTKIDLKKAVQLYKEAIKLGNISAQNNLAYCYEHGFGIEKNYEKAIEWYQSAAINGSKEAQGNLINLYLNKEENPQLAFSWSETFAKEESEVGMCYLGFCYEQGKGTEQNNKLAFEWYEKSALKGYNRSQEKVAEFYENGIGIPTNLIKAKEWRDKLPAQVQSKSKNITELRKCLMGPVPAFGLAAMALIYVFNRTFPIPL